MLHRVSLDRHAPKYHRIAGAIRNRIESGEFLPGQKLPPETFWVERYDASIPTVREALRLLRQDGLVESRHGVGTFVTDQAARGEQVAAGPWRLGRHMPLNVYAEPTAEWPEGRPVCQCHTAEDAARIVAAVNAMEA